MVNNIICFLGRNKLISGCLPRLVDMCNHFYGIFRECAKGREGEPGQNMLENGEEVA